MTATSAPRPQLSTDVESIDLTAYLLDIIHEAARENGPDTEGPDVEHEHSEPAHPDPSQR